MAPVSPCTLPRADHALVTGTGAAPEPNSLNETAPTPLLRGASKLSYHKENESFMKHTSHQTPLLPRIGANPLWRALLPLHIWKK